ncbi:hypothetical protein ACFWOJ_38915 [Streptomyces sp. NPDC058439]|uniref:hypothetical protein n=1 Tax=Streptomyces sp. NPDC058439 TaxID=3346500 RepID=UPI00365A2E86
MTDVIVSAEAAEEVQPAGMPETLDDQLIGQLVDRAKAGGIKLTGPSLSALGETSRSAGLA